MQKQILCKLCCVRIVRIVRLVGAVDLFEWGVIVKVSDPPLFVFYFVWE